MAQNVSTVHLWLWKNLLCFDILFNMFCLIIYFNKVLSFVSFVEYSILAKTDGCFRFMHFMFV